MDFGQDYFPEYVPVTLPLLPLPSIVLLPRESIVAFPPAVATPVEFRMITVRSRRTTEGTAPACTRTP
jgi:hypothetical protein